MLRVVTIGKQNFSELRKKNCFYVDKTRFIQDWWDSQDDVTLITRPRRFGKTLMLDTVRTFFSPEFAGRSDLFEDLEIWKVDEFRKLQGKIPVIFLSFARFNNNNYAGIISRIKSSLASIYSSFSNLIDLNAIPNAERNIFTSVNDSMTDERAQDSIHYLCKFLTIQHKIKPIVLLDEYDTPLQEAWLNGYWDELASFMRGFFNATFKDNPWIERGLITGITRVSKESIFSDLNNLKVVTTTTNRYTDCFGFTEQEVFAAMDEYGLTEKPEVKKWYDGFTFGHQKEIYNPWSIICYLSDKTFAPYWADTSCNALVGELVALSGEDVKDQMFDLLKGESIITKLDEQIVFSQLYNYSDAIWSFLMASGYVKPLSYDKNTEEYEISLTNYEVHCIFKKLISRWFNKSNAYANKFRQALLTDNIIYMNNFLSSIAKNTFSFFDTSGNEPERFYHAFVLGLMVDLQDRYEILSNRESGFGRYDITMFPKRSDDPGIVIEFKTLEKNTEKNLEEACLNALNQIKIKEYTDALISRGVVSSNIYVYGFAFKGKDVLIRGGAEEKLDWSCISGKQ